MCFCIRDLTAGKYRSTSYDCREAEWKEYLRTHVVSRNILPPISGLPVQTRSRWFKLRQATRVYTRIYRLCVPPLARYIYLANQRIGFPYLHRPLRFFSRNAEWSRKVLIVKCVKRVSLQWRICCVVKMLKFVLSKAVCIRANSL